MKKRIACFVMTLIMLVSLVPAAALSASATSYSVSEAAITVLKKMIPFKNTCYQVADTSEARIGYGTVCNVGKHKLEKQADGSYKIICSDPATHQISEKQADLMLRESLAKIGTSVESFAASNGIALTQQRFDAMVVLTHGIGSAWMNGSSATKTAMKGGASSSELLAALAKTYGDSNSAVLAKSKIVVNMYANGIYSNVVPGNYAKVTYDANGGTVAGQTSYTMYFDTSVSVNHPVTAYMDGSTFLGWYKDLGATLDTNEKETFMPQLNADCAGLTLKAKWQKKDNDAGQNSYDITADTDTYEKPAASGTVRKLQKSIYISFKIGATLIDSNGDKWVQIAGGDSLYKVSDEAWVYDENFAGRWVKTTVTGLTSSLAAELAVSSMAGRALYLNPDTNSRFEKDLDDRYTYVRTDSQYVDANGYRWVRIAQVWDTKYPTGWKNSGDPIGKWMIARTSAGTDIGASAGAIAKATVTYSGGYVNVRSGAGTNNTIVGSVRNGETLDIFEIVTVNGHKWGKISTGWFCLTYASITMLGGNSDVDISSEGALTYTYSGKMNADTKPYVKPDDKSGYVPYADKLTAGTNVTITNMTLVGGDAWVKVRWAVTYYDASDARKLNPLTTTASGWVKIASDSNDSGHGVNLSVSSAPVMLSGSVEYTVAGDEITVRKDPNSAAATVFKMYKGVRFTVAEIKLVGEDIWGRTAELVDATDKYESGPHTDAHDTFYKDGWVNLSTKYVSRTSLPSVESGTSGGPIGKIATIVNTDRVKVRINCDIYSRQIGTLARGTTANILAIEDGWYNLDVDVDNDPETGSWVFEDYVEVSDGTVGASGSESVVNNGDGTITTTSTTGKGVVANTYAGVNFRTGAGIGYASMGKLLPGTMMEIIEIKQGGASKWAHVKANGKECWVCMDYVTILTSTTTVTTSTTGNGQAVTSFDTVDKTTTTAIYTGTVTAAASDAGIIKKEEKEEDAEASGESGSSDTGTICVWATPKHNEDPTFAVRKLKEGDSVTIFELLAVTEIKYTTPENEDDEQSSASDNHGTTTQETITSYWARINDGYIFNPQLNIELDPLDEKVHTLTGSDTLNIRDAANGNVIDDMKKGDQVKVTELKIVNDKVWGKIEDDAAGAKDAYGFGYGWVRLDYFSEGAYYVAETKTTTTTTQNNASSGVGAAGVGGGNTGNTGAGAYSGKIINAATVNVRASASTSAKVTTQLKQGAAVTITQTTVSEGMAWGLCNAGWIYLYYVDLTPVGTGAIDAKVVYNDNTAIYSDSTGSSTVGTYSRMAVINIYEIVGKMARTDQGWVHTDNLLN